MGYTTTQSKVLLGLGASSISDSWTAFGQNIKEVETYIESLTQGELPIVKGHLLSDEDLFIRKQILNIICQLETSWRPEDWTEEEKEFIFDKLSNLESDGLICLENTGLKVSPKGKTFVRNICMVFDKYLKSYNTQEKLFSRTI